MYKVWWIRTYPNKLNTILKFENTILWSHAAESYKKFSTARYGAARAARRGRVCRAVSLLWSKSTLAWMLDKLTQLSQPVVSISSNMFLSQHPLRESKDLGFAMEDSFSSKFIVFAPKKVFWMSLKIREGTFFVKISGKRPKLVEISRNGSKGRKAGGGVPSHNFW